MAEPEAFVARKPKNWGKIKKRDSINETSSSLLRAAQRTEDNPSIQDVRRQINDLTIPELRSNELLSKLNNSVMFNPYIGDLVQRGRNAQKSRQKNF